MMSDGGDGGDGGAGVEPWEPFSEDNQWYFYDEEDELYGPYQSEAAAEMDASEMASRL